jgi:hypothetical protein
LQHFLFRNATTSISSYAIVFKNAKQIMSARRAPPLRDNMPQCTIIIVAMHKRRYR